MDTQQSSSTTLPQPLRTAASALRKVPGAGMVGRAAGGALDKVGAVSPRGRRIAVYTGAGVLGVAGVVEWPVAVTGAAVAWLTQPRPDEAQSTSVRTVRAASGVRGRATAPGTRKSAAPPSPRTLKATAQKKATTQKKATAQKKTTAGPGGSAAGGGTTARRAGTTG